MYKQREYAEDNNFVIVFAEDDYKSHEISIFVGTDCIRIYSKEDVRVDRLGKNCVDIWHRSPLPPEST